MKSAKQLFSLDSKILHAKQYRDIKPTASTPDQISSWSFH